MIPSNRLIKYILPDGKKLIVHAPVVDTLLTYTQRKISDSESGGFLLGYENSKNKSVIIESLTIPQSKDNKSRIHFTINDSKHIFFLENAQLDKSFFLGTWHTHPQDYVIPSVADWIDWKKSIKNERPGARYMLFIIVGRMEIGVWCVDMATTFKKIKKLKKAGD